MDVVDDYYDCCDHYYSCRHYDGCGCSPAVNMDSFEFIINEMNKLVLDGGRLHLNLIMVVRNCAMVAIVTER